MDGQYVPFTALESMSPPFERAALSHAPFKGEWVSYNQPLFAGADLLVRRGELLLMRLNVKQCIVINLPSAEISAYLCNLENLVDWSSIVIAVRNGSSEKPSVGATARSTIRFLGRWFDIAFEIVEYEPSRFLTIKSTSGIAPCLFYYQFEAVEDGGTTVSQDVLIDLIEEPSDVAATVVTNALRRQLTQDLLTLKDMLEASAAQCKECT